MSNKWLEDFEGLPCPSCNGSDLAQVSHNIYVGIECRSCHTSAPVGIWNDLPRPVKKISMIWIVCEDARETGLLNDGFGVKVFGSHLEACTFCIKRMWYFNYEDRKEIADYRRKFGDIKAYKYFNTGWVYAPAIYKRKLS